jgi:hypothetical protein
MTATAGAAWLPQQRQVELSLRTRLATMPPGERLPSDEELCRGSFAFAAVPDIQPNVPPETILALRAAIEEVHGG